MDKLTHSQFILLVLLVSFVTSLFTGIVTATLVSQAPSPITQTVNRVIEKTVETIVPNLGGGKEPVPVAATQEEIVVGIVGKVSSAVVSVVATKDLPVIEKYYVNPFENDQFFKQFFPQDFLPQIEIPQYRQNGTEKKEVGSGTGFFISQDGLLLTNKHVVEDSAADYSVVMNDGEKLAAKVLARDSLQDIAVLRVDLPADSKKNFNFIPLGDSDMIKVGQTAIVIGNSLGEFQNTVSVGVVSGLNRTVVASNSVGSFSERLQEVIQTDAAINPGNSGGPLLGLEGKAIGINTAMAQGAENVGFALPINIVKKAVADVKEFGKIRYAFLGVRYQDTPDKQGVVLAKGQNEELAVMKNSPAEKAGLKEGDKIFEFNGTAVDKSTTFAKLLTNSRVGESVRLKILRGEQTLEVNVTLDERPENI